MLFSSTMKMHLCWASQIENDLGAPDAQGGDRGAQGEIARVGAAGREAHGAAGEVDDDVPGALVGVEDEFVENDLRRGADIEDRIVEEFQHRRRAGTGTDQFVGGNRVAGRQLAQDRVKLAGNLVFGRRRFADDVGPGGGWAKNAKEQNKRLEPRHRIPLIIERRADRILKNQIQPARIQSARSLPATAQREPRKSPRNQRAPILRSPPVASGNCRKLFLNLGYVAE